MSKTRLHVITAWAEGAAGPGWANQPLWYLVDDYGKLRVECLQPDEQSSEIKTLYAMSEVTHLAMTAAVRRALRAKTR